jgi:hypothetical protein
MKNQCPTNLLKSFQILAACGLGWCYPSLLKADVVMLENGGVLAGTVLQQDDEGILIKMDSGTHRYPASWIKTVKKEPAAAHHVSNNGRRIPDWAQIVTLLANTGWSQGLKQVPATMIESGIWKNVPYISFQCRSDGYALNIFGDLEDPAAVQIGAMSYLKQSDEAKSNCVNFICSVLANLDDRKMIRALSSTQKDRQQNGKLTAETLMPGEWGSYGGWWVSVYSEKALATARASDAELFALTHPPAAAPQPAFAPAPPAAVAPPAAAPPGVGAAPPQAAGTASQPPPTTTTATAYAVPTTYVAPAWSAEELARARAVPGANPAATAAREDTAAKVYPRTYTRTGGTYGHTGTRR